MASRPRGVVGSAAETSQEELARIAVQRLECQPMPGTLAGEFVRRRHQGATVGRI
jgi:hypothetical protein